MDISTNSVIVGEKDYCMGQLAQDHPRPVIEETQLEALDFLHHDFARWTALFMNFLAFFLSDGKLEECMYVLKSTRYVKRGCNELIMKKGGRKEALRSSN